MYEMKFEPRKALPYSFFMTNKIILFLAIDNMHDTEIVVILFGFLNIT
jgi:hypothetical protein